MRGIGQDAQRTGGDRFAAVLAVAFEHAVIPIVGLKEAADAPGRIQGRQQDGGASGERLQRRVVQMRSLQDVRRVQGDLGRIDQDRPAVADAAVAALHRQGETGGVGVSPVDLVLQLQKEGSQFDQAFSGRTADGLPDQDGRTGYRFLALQLQDEGIPDISPAEIGQIEAGP